MAFPTDPWLICFAHDQ